MKRKLFRKDEVYWDNPIKEIQPAPYLGDYIFPEDPRSGSAAKATDLLARFYCQDRLAYRSDLRKLKAYLSSPNEQLFIVEGDVGIGKTWFIRYELEQNKKQKNYGGVIDLLRAGPEEAQRTIYRQVCPIVEGYFSYYFGSPANALRKYGEQRYLLRHGEKGKGLDKEESRHAGKDFAQRYLKMEDGQDLAEILLLTLEYLNGPMLFLAIDNMDRVSEGDQERLVELVQRILRNACIRLIVPLRTTSPFLMDRFRGLHEVRHESMRLSSLRLRTMLEPRFCKSESGDDLTHTPVIEDGVSKNTFPKLFQQIIKSEVGDLLFALSGSNCRVALLLAKRLLQSDQLKGLTNIDNPQYAMALPLLVWVGRPGSRGARLGVAWRSCVTQTYTARFWGSSPRGKSTRWSWTGRVARFESA